jgi:Domain of unknown function (DUF4276)
MKALLDGLLPRIFPGLIEMQHFQCVPHEGKTDLDHSIPRKLRAWREPGVRFVVVRDNDNQDCIDLKARLAKLCSDSGRPDTLIRLVCQELESWYIGDLKALQEAFPDHKIYIPVNRKKYNNPDDWQKPSEEVRRLARSFQKLTGARIMATELRRTENCSRSFQTFLDGIDRIAHDMGYDAENT